MDFPTEPRERVAYLKNHTEKDSSAGTRPSVSCTSSPLPSVSPAIQPRPEAVRAEVHTASTREQLGVRVRVHEVCNLNKPRWGDLLHTGTAQLPRCSDPSRIKSEPPPSPTPIPGITRSTWIPGYRYQIPHSPRDLCAFLFALVLGAEPLLWISTHSAHTSVAAQLLRLFSYIQDHRIAESQVHRKDRLL